MSLFNLSSMVSKEDFADSHEPVNDGVKEVPNAQTIAAGVKTSDTGTDTNNAGDAKIIPEKEETGDNTEKQFDTVSESDEKSTTATPAAKSTDDAPDTEANIADDTTTEEAAKPVDAPLEHETKEAAEDEQKKTETVTKSLENYAEPASRFDVVGYPKVTRDKIQQRMNWLARRTGQPTNMTISAESINQMVSVGQARAISLGDQVKEHAKRKTSLESIGDIPFTPEVVVEPVAESSIDNLAVDLAEGITERETDPLDVGIIGIDQVVDTLEVLEDAQIAIERHTQILKSTPFISQQAAAVLQASLEHIDRVCGLKVRATGLEGYDTTPRSALAKANISIESLNGRAADIGAKILMWIKELLERANKQWQHYKAGLTGVLADARKTKELTDGLKGTPSKNTLTLKTTPDMYMGSEFTGASIHANVAAAPKFLRVQYSELRNALCGDFTTILNSGTDDTLERLKQVPGELTGSAELELPGGVSLVREGALVGLKRSEEPAHPGAVEVDLNRPEMRRQIAAAIKYLETLSSDNTLDVLKGAQSSISKSLIAFRKGAGKDLDETQRQQIQSYVISETSKAFSITSYFRTISYLTKQAATVVRLHEAMAKAWGVGSEE